MFENAFCKIPLQLVEDFCLNGGGVTDYVNRMKANSRMQIEARGFQG
ncbi:MAG: DUF6783 domain-containing protein [Anaerobutyricum soehngenii]